MTDGGDIEPARRDVARHQKLELPVAKAVERPEPRILVHVAMQRADRISMALERAVEGRHVALAIAEDDRVGEIGACRVDELPQRRALLVRFAARGDEALDDVLAGRGRLGDFHAHRVAEEPVDELRDLRRHCRREEERLPREGEEFDDPLDVGDEAHVEHAVGLVDDENLNAGQKQPAAFEMIEQSAGGCDQHVGAARDDLVLLVEGHAADQEREAELMVDAVASKAVLHLACKLARRLEDQRARHPRARTAVLEQRQHRQDEGGCLARAGLGKAENVAAFQHVRDRLFLDWGWGCVAGGLYGRNDLVA